MTGRKANGVAAVLLEQNESILTMGCVGHLIDMAVKKNNEIDMGYVSSKTVEVLDHEENLVNFSIVKGYYIKILDLMGPSIPFSKDVLRNAEVLNPNKISTKGFSKLLYFIEQFPAVLMHKLGKDNE
ncbi:hypothetical protein CEXT_29581 [Caerostris extrusa]|uniref:Uncharacterized protein n=1 Tax=Caerostris extrusa TaxID=172846 RepID=A0AAV4NES2_CAEEX|nr:hypothetical protein CEXT_29581 [Caerostris extrusa]